VLAPPPDEFVEHRRDDAGARGADRVAEGDRAPVDVQAVVIEPEVAVTGEHLRGEGLVQLDQVIVTRRAPRARLEARAGGDRAEAHDGGIHARLRRAPHPGEG